MNQDMAQGKWQQLSGKIKQKWGKLTDDDLTRAAGDRDYLVGKLHEQYGIARDRAESELDNLGYGEHDEDADLRSSSRSAAGRMDLAGEPGSGRKLQAGGSGQADVDSQDNADNGGDLRGGESQEARYQPAGHTLEAAPGSRQSPSGSSAGKGGSSPSQKSTSQQKGGRNAPGSGSSDR